MKWGADLVQQRSLAGLSLPRLAAPPPGSPPSSQRGWAQSPGEGKEAPIPSTPESAYRPVQGGAFPGRCCFPGPWNQG